MQEVHSHQQIVVIWTRSVSQPFGTFVSIALRKLVKIYLTVKYMSLIHTCSRLRNLIKSNFNVIFHLFPFKKVFFTKFSKTGYLFSA